jgi:predicted PurR-regulated permease PerM
VLVAEAYPAHSSSRRPEGADRLIGADRGVATTPERSSSSRFLRVLVGVLCLLALLFMSPLWAPLLLAGWTALLVSTPHERLGNKLGGSSRAAAALTVIFVVILIVPLVLVTVSLVGGAVDLAKNVLAAGGGLDSVRAIFAGSSGATKLEAQNVDRLFELAQQHGAGAWRALRVVAGATANIVIGAFVFVLGLYAFLVDGRRFDRWLELNLPLPHGSYRRFATAFVETGRGLFIGVGLTALAQALVLTIGYFAIGLPQAAMLGAVTLVAALIPAGGAGIVWVPLSAGLALTGRVPAAVVVLVLGVIASTGDNFLRPWLSRYAKLNLPTFALLVAMLGGVALLGARGLLLGPLLLRWAVEGLSLIRERRLPAPAR